MSKRREVINDNHQHPFKQGKGDHCIQMVWGGANQTTKQFCSQRKEHELHDVVLLGTDHVFKDGGTRCLQAVWDESKGKSELCDLPVSNRAHWIVKADPPSNKANVFWDHEATEEEILRTLIGTHFGGDATRFFMWCTRQEYYSAPLHHAASMDTEDDAEGYAEKPYNQETEQLAATTAYRLGQFMQALTTEFPGLRNEDGDAYPADGIVTFKETAGLVWQLKLTLLGDGTADGN